MQIENLVIKNQIEDAISLFDKIDDKYDKKRVRKMNIYSSIC